MTVRCESDDARMEKTGELLDSGDGELREELECAECGATAAIYTTRDGNELLEEGAYSDRDLEVDFSDADETVDWEGTLSHTSWSTSYDRQASTTMTIDGPEGKLVAVKSYRAMLDDDNSLMESGKIAETVQYYREDENSPFDDCRVEWDVPTDELESPTKFLDDCREAAEADPQFEYEQRQNEL